MFKWKRAENGYVYWKIEMYRTLKYMSIRAIDNVMNGRQTMSFTVFCIVDKWSIRLQKMTFSHIPFLSGRRSIVEEWEEQTHKQVPAKVRCYSLELCLIYNTIGVYKLKAVISGDRSVLGGRREARLYFQVLCVLFYVCDTISVWMI